MRANTSATLPRIGNHDADRPDREILRLRLNVAGEKQQRRTDDCANRPKSHLDCPA